MFTVRPNAPPSAHSIRSMRCPRPTRIFPLDGQSKEPARQSSLQTARLSTVRARANSIFSVKGVADGYAGDLELTQKRFLWLDPGDAQQVRAYRTGDLVSRNVQGDLVFVERLDDQVKRRGFRFSLREVDEDLLAIHGVREARTIKLDAPGVTCQIFSFVQLDDSSETAQNRLKADLFRLAPAFRIPNQIVALDKLPLNANGKIDLPQLQRLAAEISGRPGSIDPAAGDNAMGDDLEFQIRKIFAAHCLEPHCPPDRDFFEAGGDFLGAAECLLELEELLGAPLSYSDFLAEPTISGVKRIIERAQLQERCEMRRSGPATASRCLVYFGERGDLLQAGLGPNFRVLWRSPTDFGRPDVLSFASVRDLAHAYTESLLPLLGGAPSAVVGFSYGAVLGLEVASHARTGGPRRRRPDPGRPRCRRVLRHVLSQPVASSRCREFRGSGHRP